MWLMLQQDQPDDYVVGTGQTHSVRELCQVAFGHLGLNYQDYIKTDSRFIRPADVDLLVSDSTKARADLSWEPQVPFEDLVVMMVESDLKQLQAEALFP
jgi:GDPmannose 4,6-dehydratase